MRKIFHRLSGIILSTSLIFTGLNLTNITESFAEEPKNKASNSSEETTEEANYANIENIEIIGEDRTMATVEVILDKEIEDTDMPLFIYEEGNPEFIEQVSEGGSYIYIDLIKTDKPQYIYATTGASTSDVVIVDPLIEFETFEITTDKTVMTNSDSNPIISWNTFDIPHLSYYPVFIVDSNGEVVYESDRHGYDFL